MRHGTIVLAALLRKRGTHFYCGTARLPHGFPPLPFDSYVCGRLPGCFVDLSVYFRSLVFPFLAAAGFQLVSFACQLLCHPLLCMPMRRCPAGNWHGTEKTIDRTGTPPFLQCCRHLPKKIKMFLNNIIKHAHGRHALFLCSAKGMAPVCISCVSGIYIFFQKLIDKSEFPAIIKT